MKKLILLIFIILIYLLLSKAVFTNKDNKINIKLKNEIAILLLDNDILIKMKNNDDLLILGNDSDISNIKTKDLGVILLKDMPINIKYNNKYLLQDSMIINNINYNVNNNIIDIKYNDTIFCIFNSIGSVINDTRECNFLYLYNINNIDELYIDERIEIVFINNNVNLPIHFLEDIYSKDIDIYALDKNKITVIKLQDDDYSTFVIPNE